MYEIDLLKKLYIENLSEVVSWNGVNRQRVKHPKNWERLDPIIDLPLGADKPLSLTGKKVWVWSDLHFFHKNIINFSDRPYSSVEEMNEHLVANFNYYVEPDDVSIWVGDVGFKSDQAINELLDQCNGYKILVIGNHDFNKGKVRNLNFDETHLIYQWDVTPEVNLVFTHYPMSNISLPWFNIHGHLHAYPVSDTGNILHYNVCCELHEYKPIEITEIVNLAKFRLTSAKQKEWE